MAATADERSGNGTPGKYREVELLSSSLSVAIQSDLSGLLAGDTQALKNLVDMNLLLFEKIVALESGAKISLMSQQKIQNRAHQLERENSYLRQEFADLEFKMATIEDLTKRMNLRIEGLPEEQNEVLKTMVSTYFAKTGVVCQPTDIDFASRVGKFKPGQNRPVLVRLTREGLRNEILFNRNKINNNSNVTVWLNDDLSEITRRHRKNARDVASLARMNGMTNIKTQSDGLVIEDTKYRFPDFDLLPSSLTLDKAKNRDDGEDVFFQSEHSPLSNFFPVTIVDSMGMVYESAEQAFQYRKAKAHGSHSLANKIMSMGSPYKAKQFGKKVQVERAWKQQENDVMSDILLAKFTQNKNIGKYLIGTAGKQLHEATTDRKWAVGADLSSKALRSEDWKGSDVLGQLLEATRDTLIATYGGAPTQSTCDGIDPPGGQYLPMSDDEASDSYEECIQAEDEIRQSETTSHQDTGASTSVPANVNTSDLSGNTSAQPKSRNPYRTSSAQKTTVVEETDSPFDTRNQDSQALALKASNVSTRTQRTRRRKKRRSSEQLSSHTIPKQIF